MHYPLERLAGLIDKGRRGINKVTAGSLLQGKLLFELIRAPQIIRIYESYPFTLCKIDSPDPCLKSSEVVGIYVIPDPLILFGK